MFGLNRLIRRVVLLVSSPAEIDALRSELANLSRETQKAITTHASVLERAITWEEEEPAFRKVGLAYIAELEGHRALRSARDSYLRTGKVDVAAIKSAAMTKSKTS